MSNRYVTFEQKAELILDSNNTNTSPQVAKTVPKKLRVRIEASHAGIINGNNVFYTPKALREGAVTLVEPFEKHLQRKHYSTALGVIKKAYYQESEDILTKKLDAAKTPLQLTQVVNEYIKSPEFKNTPKGIGALFVEGDIHSEHKINELRDSSGGFVSIAGGSARAFCNLCASPAGTCSHEAGKTYNKRKAFIIFDSAVLDHISFEEYPADWDTNTKIIADSGSTKPEQFSLAILDYNHKILGKNMTDKNSASVLADFKAKLGKIEDLYTEFNLKTPVSITDSLTPTEYLFAEDKILSLDSKENLLVGFKTLAEIEDSLTVVEKDYLRSKLDDQYAIIVGDLSLDELETQLTSVQDSATLEEQPEPETPSEFELKITQLLDSHLTKVLGEKQEAGNELLKSEIRALKNEKIANLTLIQELTTELRDSLLNTLTSKVSDVNYIAKVKDSSIKEIKLAIELADALEVPQVIEVVDSLKTPATPAVTETVSFEDAAQTMQTSNEEQVQIEDAMQQIIDSYSNTTLTSSQIKAIFKEHSKTKGFTFARQLTEILTKTKEIK